MVSGRSQGRKATNPEIFFGQWIEFTRVFAGTLALLLPCCYQRPISGTGFLMVERRRTLPKPFAGYYILVLERFIKKFEDQIDGRRRVAAESSIDKPNPFRLTNFGGLTWRPSDYFASGSVGAGIADILTRCAADNSV
ncbi:MAG: hypothetical protein WCF85_20895 [Rhodospirillaceae bacterium]